MKPVLYCAIALSVVLASITVPALQASAAEDVPPTPTKAWNEGHTDGEICVKVPANCKFNNIYKKDADGNNPPGLDDNTTALYNTDYIVGFIAGKAEANK